MEDNLKELLSDIDEFKQDFELEVIYHDFVSEIFTGLFLNDDIKFDINNMSKYFYNLIFACLISDNRNTEIWNVEQFKTDYVKSLFQKRMEKSPLFALMKMAIDFKEILKNQHIKLTGTNVDFQIKRHHYITLYCEDIKFDADIPFLLNYDDEDIVNILKIIFAFRIDTLKLLAPAVELFGSLAIIEGLSESDRKTFYDWAKVEKDIEDFNKLIEDLRKYYLEDVKPNLSDWKKDRRVLFNIENFKSALIKASQKDEIKDVTSLIALCPPDFKFDLLCYIADHNKPYYQDLEEKYETQMDHSIVKYIKEFEKYNLNFSSFTIDNQKEIIKKDINYVSLVLSFVKKINCNDYNIIHRIIMESNIEIINYITDFINKGIIDSSFVNGNISLLIENSNTLKNFIINNQNITKYNINFINKSRESMDVLISNPDTVLKNIEYLENKILPDNTKISYKTRFVVNYSFLSDNLLIQKLEYFIDNGININDNLDILNSDDEIIIRIKTLKRLNYDLIVEGKINSLIIEKDKFPIPIEEAQEFLKQDEKTI